MLNFPFQTLEQHYTFKESMINWLSNLINLNRSAAKMSQVLCSSEQSLSCFDSSNWSHSNQSLEKTSFNSATESQCKMLSIPLNARRLGGGRWGPSYDHDGEVTRCAQYTPHLPILQPRETGLLFSLEKFYAVDLRPFGHSKLTRKRIFKVTSIVWLMV